MRNLSPEQAVFLNYYLLVSYVIVSFLRLRVDNIVAGVKLDSSLRCVCTIGTARFVDCTEMNRLGSLNILSTRTVFNELATGAGRTVPAALLESFVVTPD